VGFEYVDVSKVLAGHDACQKDNWINRAILSSVQLSFHPNAEGQKAMAARMLDCIKNSCAADSARSPAAEFQVFGSSRGDVTLRSTEPDGFLITPPLGRDMFSALWGGYRASRSCEVTIVFDATPVSPANDNYGIAVVPKSSIRDDQPHGDSIQYEHEATPDFANTGTYVRPATLPGGAYRVDVPPTPAPDIAATRHIETWATNGRMGMRVDGTPVAEYDSADSCGGQAIRVWGSAFEISNLRIQNS
jgi:hypothetical protein